MKPRKPGSRGWWPILPKSFEKILAKAVKAYGADGILASYIEDVDGRHGDILAEFIVRKAGDVFSAQVSAKENARQIAAALHAAGEQLMAVSEAIKAKARK